MRSHLINGKIDSSISTLAAQERQRQLAYEIAKMEREVQGVSPPQARSILGCMGWLRSEERQLRELLKARDAPLLPSREEMARQLQEEKEEAEAFWNE